MRAALLVVGTLLVTATAARAQTTAAAGVAADVAAPTASAPPDVGQVAPDFTLASVDPRTGASAPFTLSAMRGKVVVLAFYPKDRTGGCTAELTKFRDEYTSLFGSRVGKDVVVVPISADGVASHASWSKESNFPFALVSDTALTAVSAYGSRMGSMPLSQRTVFVIGKDGTVKYRDLKFNALDEGEYAKLKDAVAKAG
ncbi:MAG TPA: redoxin domain-containing protein [Gemmatirosa sp.]